MRCLAEPVTVMTLPPLPRSRMPLAIANDPTTTATASSARPTRSGTRSRMPPIISGGRLAVSEQAVGRVLPRAVLLAQPVGKPAGLLDQVAIESEPREAQVAPPRLARAEQRALAAQVQVGLGELEAVGRVDERLQPPLGRLRQLLDRPRDEQAVALLAAAPDAAAQLVQLREPEAVGFLHDHDRRVRDVDADLDHGRRDEHVELVRGELPHHLAPLGGLEPPVQQAHAVAGELAAPQALGLRLGGARE